MSIVGDLRQPLQDVVAPDLKAVVAGLNALRDEVRSGNVNLREEIGLLRDELRLNSTELKTEIASAEKRAAERLERIYDAVKISDLTRRNAELEIELAQLRKAQQH